MDPIISLLIILGVAALIGWGIWIIPLPPPLGWLKYLALIVLAIFVLIRFVAPALHSAV